MLVDGADEQKLVKQMKSEIASMKSRHEFNQGAVKRLGRFSASDGDDWNLDWIGSHVR